MRLRTLVTTVMAVAISGGAAGAAPRQVCHLLGAGRTGDWRDEVPDDAVKITSADIASNQRYLTAVVRVRSVADALSATSGRDFTFYVSPNAETRPP